LPTQSEKPRFVAAMFGRIARRYDRMNTLMTVGQDQRWRRAVAAIAVGTRNAERGTRNAEPGTGNVILDVGTGTGKLAEAVLEVAPGARVIGVDFSEAMLRVAPRNLQLAGADALRLPFGDGCFDAVVSAFVVRNLADVQAGVAEQVRVLRPGGQLVILETTPGPPGWLRPLFRLYMRGVVPRLGQLIAGEPSAYSYLPESTLAFLEPARLADVLRQNGLVDLHIRQLGLGSIAITLGTKPGA
jgi:demethylmenaquinone methyltransferase/2-methoxy-6-polyprenyl-1,4-benzoquinol methylase